MCHHVDRGVVALAELIVRPPRAVALPRPGAGPSGGAQEHPGSFLRSSEYTYIGVDHLLGHFGTQAAHRGTNPADRHPRAAIDSLRAGLGQKWTNVCRPDRHGPCWSRCPATRPQLNPRQPPPRTSPPDGRGTPQHSAGRHPAEPPASRNRGRNQMASKAEKIVAGLGGIDNIEEVEGCITRLRTEVKDASLVNEAALKAAGAHGVVKMGTAIQVVIGTDADPIAADIEDMM
ncbi:PTS glucose/sucrose transporter subunit IIB [Kitasatospora sp. SUK 42]|nr:PTS glucose/sucrose transporter subunit IIB [Kitasatospora sp. SUK 42]